jgi:hypothetical protein
MSSKCERLHDAASARLDEWKEEDLEDLESVSSGGEPGDSRGVLDGQSVDIGRIRGRMRKACFWFTTAAGLARSK